MTRHLGKRPRLYQEVAEKLSVSILSGNYRVGDRLPPERDLAAAHNVSRPTIREAIIALELDGLIEVRMGSGVYVKAVRPIGTDPVAMDVGPFELTEARLILEGEVAALAATLITDAELLELEKLLDVMEHGNRSSDAEKADRQFHQCIADATRNGAMSTLVDSLWTIHGRSPQCVRMFEKMRAKGYRPVISEHRAIFNALRTRDPNSARIAMRDHLKRVLNYLLDTTEVEAIEETKAKMNAQRDRFAASTKV
jgi:GntR family transcriptional regulator, hexuronate regulon transcriptional repressor